VKAIGQYALVTTGALAASAVLFVATFAVLEFVWTHFVLSNPKESQPCGRDGRNWRRVSAWGHSGWGGFWPSAVQILAAEALKR